MSLTVYYKHKQQIVSFFYINHKSNYSGIFIDEIDETSKPFDCFFSYCQEDKDTTSAILEKFEKEQPHYNFCTRDRNWKLGSYIPSNVFQSVKNSRKTLMIVSEAFVKQSWFHLQFQVAFHQVLHDSDYRLILILKDLPDETSLPRDVQYYLDTRSCLHWGEPWFWERLKYSLEDDNIEEKCRGNNIKGTVRSLK